MIVELNSVGSVVDTETLFTYPKYINGGYDKDGGIHICEVSDEWYSSLNEEDKYVVDTLLFMTKSNQ